jgi:hypothetical protein
MKGSDKAIEQLLNVIDTDKETQELLKSIVPDGVKLKTEAVEITMNNINGYCPLSQGKSKEEA